MALPNPPTIPLPNPPPPQNPPLPQDYFKVKHIPNQFIKRKINAHGEATLVSSHEIVVEASFTHHVPFPILVISRFIVQMVNEHLSKNPHYPSDVFRVVVHRGIEQGGKTILVDYLIFNSAFGRQNNNVLSKWTTPNNPNPEEAKSIFAHIRGLNERALSLSNCLIQIDSISTRAK